MVETVMAPERPPASPPERRRGAGRVLVAVGALLCVLAVVAVGCVAAGVYAYGKWREHEQEQRLEALLFPESSPVEPVRDAFDRDAQMHHQIRSEMPDDWGRAVCDFYETELTELITAHHEDNAVLVVANLQVVGEAKPSRDGLVAATVIGRVATEDPIFGHAKGEPSQWRFTVERDPAPNRLWCLAAVAASE